MISVASRKEMTHMAALKAMLLDCCFFLLRELLAGRLPLEAELLWVWEEDFEAAVVRL